MPIYPENKKIRRIILESFVGGTAWGVGTAIGATLIIALLGFIVAQARTVPIIGRFVYNVEQEVRQLREK